MATQVRPRAGPGPDRHAPRGASRRLLRKPRHRHSTLVANNIPDGIRHAAERNGMLGIGPFRMTMRSIRTSSTRQADRQSLPQTAISTARRASR